MPSPPGVAALGGVLALCAALCGPARAQDVPRTEGAFTAHVAAELRRTLKDAPVVVTAPLTLKVGSFQANLNRVFDYCRTDTDHCRQEIATYVTTLAHVYQGDAGPPSREALRIVVRPRDYAQYTRNQEIGLQPRDLAGGLVMLPVIDQPTTLRQLVAADLATLGIAADEAFKLGLANLRKQFKPLPAVAKPVVPGKIGVLASDPYQSSRLALHDSWAPLAQAQGGHLIVAAPATDTVLYIAGDSPEMIDGFRAFVGNVSARSSHPLSTELLRWKASGWEPVR